MLAGVASEKEDNSDDDSDHSSVREVVFSTPISPSRGTMLPPARPTTPEAEVARKRSFTLVHRTPEKPREAPVAPTTPLNTITRETSPVTATPPAPAEIPASTAPARLDGRERRAGKNAAYLEAIAIERGRGAGWAWWARTRRDRHSGGPTYTPSCQPISWRQRGRQASHGSEVFMALGIDL